METPATVYGSKLRNVSGGSYIKSGFILSYLRNDFFLM